jgi:hypothetical protein
MGGDEWAFRMVTRAYEVLKTTSAVPPSPVWASRSATIGPEGQSPDWSRIWDPSFGKPGTKSTSSDSHNQRATRESPADLGSDSLDDEEPATNSGPAPTPVAEPDELRIVDVELIWTRFEKEGSGQLLSTQEGDDATLSVCMVISWPPHELIDHAAAFTSTGETLRSLIEVFADLRNQKSVVAARSRIEDGQFVGWLSYVDVLTAQDAFLTLRDIFRGRGQTVKLYTRDERVPFDWYGTSHQPVMSNAS